MCFGGKLKPRPVDRHDVFLAMLEQSALAGAPKGLTGFVPR